MSKKVINGITGKGVVSKNILIIKIKLAEEADKTPPITEENFADFFGITYSEYIALRSSINDFRINLQAIYNGAILYDMLYFPGLYYKTNHSNGSIYDLFYPAQIDGTNAIECIVIQSNEDLSFKSVEIEWVSNNESDN
jgi:hypothetical protein